MRLRIAASVAAAAVLLWPGLAAGSEQATSRALRILLAASATPIPARSSCAGTLPGVTRVTLGALVASRLATFEAGDNRVDGACDARGACRVAITRSAGEDVENSEFRFRTRRGVLLPASLQCLSTP